MKLTEILPMALPNNNSEIFEEFKVERPEGDIIQYMEFDRYMDRPY